MQCDMNKEIMSGQKKTTNIDCWKINCGKMMNIKKYIENQMPIDYEFINRKLAEQLFLLLVNLL